MNNLPTSSKDGLFEYHPVTLQTFGNCLEVMRKSYFLDDSVCKALALSANPEALRETEEFCMEIAKDGVSVLAVEKRTGVVVAVLFAKLQVNEANKISFFEDFASKCKNSESKMLIQVFIEAHVAANLFELCQAECLLDAVFLAVAPAYRAHGIAFDLSMLFLEIGKSLFNGYNVKTPLTENEVLRIEPIPQCVCGVCTSIISSFIGKRLNFTIAGEISYKTFTFKGKTLASLLGPNHPTPGAQVIYLKF